VFAFLLTVGKGLKDRGMSKRFLDCNLDQMFLLPPSLRAWLPEGHVGRFVAEVVERLDLWAIYAKYDEGDGRGQAAYDPRMTVRVLIYGYCRGVASSRRIERATYEDLGFRYWAADEHPDHDTIDIVWIPGHRDGDSEIIVMGIPI
jgi:transposase